MENKIRDLVRETRMKVGTPTYDFPIWDRRVRHYIYPVTLRRRGHQMTVHFATSLSSGDTPPTINDVLAVLTKSDPGTLPVFIREFGYSSDDPNVGKIWLGCVREWRAVNRVFGDCLDTLALIV